MSQHHTYKVNRVVSIGLGLLSAITLAIVTVVAEKSDGAPAVAVAMPGLICHLLIAGGHGGTHPEEVAGFTVAVTVNASLGAAFFRPNVYGFQAVDAQDEHLNPAAN